VLLIIFYFYIGDQTCGSFRQCNDGGLSSTAVIIFASTIGPIVLIAICICYIRYRCLRNINNARTIHQTSGNQDLQTPVYLLTENSGTQANSVGQVYNICTLSLTDLNREEPPPTYEVAMASSAIQNQNKI